MKNLMDSQRGLFVISFVLGLSILLVRYLPWDSGVIHSRDAAVLSESLAEDLQVLVLGAAAVFGVLIAKKTSATLLRVYFYFVSAGIVFVIGEELAWGQQIFGWDTPEGFAELNAQDQTTLHNLEVFQAPSDALMGLNVLFLAPLLASLFLALAWVLPTVSKRLSGFAPVVPGWGTIPLFGLSAAFPIYFAAQQSSFLATFVEVPRLVELVDWELGELGMYLGVFLWLVNVHRGFAAGGTPKSHYKK